MQNAKEHPTRIEDTEDATAVSYAREALSYRHRTMDISTNSIAAGCDGVTMIGPEELQAHCVYGLSAAGWNIALRTPGSEQVVIDLGKQFSEDYNDKEHRCLLGEDDTVLARWAKCKGLGYRAELYDFGFWSRSHASWYFAATETNINNTTHACNADAYAVAGSSGHSQAWRGVVASA